MRGVGVGHIRGEAPCQFTQQGFFDLLEAGRAGGCVACAVAGQHLIINRRGVLVALVLRSFAQRHFSLAEAQVLPQALQVVATRQLRDEISRRDDHIGARRPRFGKVLHAEL